MVGLGLGVWQVSLLLTLHSGSPHTDRQIKFHEITIVLLTLAHCRFIRLKMPFSSRLGLEP